MRAYLSAFALLAACTPQAPPAARLETNAPVVQPQAPADPYAAALSAAPAPGRWFFLSDEAVLAAAFGASETERLLTIACSSVTVTVDLSHDLAPDQDTTLRIIAASRTLDLPARSYTHDTPPSMRADLSVDAPEAQPLIAMLGAPLDRFAIEAAGQVTVFTWDESIAQTLNECRR